MKKLPYIQFYTGDWLKDPQLSLCTSATRGVWIDLLCAMHEFNRSGELSGTIEQMMRLTRCTSTVELAQALTDLQATGAADVSRRNGIYTVTCRRMRKAAERQRINSVNGSKRASQYERRPDIEDDSGCEKILREHAKTLGLPESDGSACFHKWQGNGWTNGGEPIRDWRSTMRSWKEHGYLPSQKVNGHAQPPQQKARIERPTTIPAGFQAWLDTAYPDKAGTPAATLNQGLLDSLISEFRKASL